MACVLATLSVIEPRTRSQSVGPSMSNEDSISSRMASKLDFYPRPNFTDLMNQLKQEDLLNTTENLKNLTKVVTTKFAPLTLAKEVTECMSKIVEKNKDFEKYKKPIENACAHRLVLQISQMYSSISYKRLTGMFFSGWAEDMVEDFVIQMVKKKYIWCRMSHREKRFAFRPPLRLERTNFIKNHLASLANSMEILYEKELAQEQDYENRVNLFKRVRSQTNLDYVGLKRRSQQISGITSQQQWRKLQERKKNQIEQEKLKREKQRQKQHEKEKYWAKQQERRNDQRRIQAEEEERSNIIRGIRNTMAIMSSVLPEEVAKHTGLNEVEEMFDSNNLQTEVMKQIEEKKIRDAVTKIEEGQKEECLFNDYLVRACRRQEIELLHKQYKEEAEKNTSKNLNEYENYLKIHKAEQQRKKKLKEMFSKSRHFTDYFKQAFEGRQMNHFEANLKMQEDRKRKHEAEQDRYRKQREKEKQQTQPPERIVNDTRGEMAIDPRQNARPPVQQPTRAPVTQDPHSAAEQPAQPPPQQRIPMNKPMLPPDRAPRVAATKMEAPKLHQDRADEQNWRTAKRPQRRRFINTKKEREPAAVKTESEQPQTRDQSQNIRGQNLPRANSRVSGIGPPPRPHGGNTPNLERPGLGPAPRPHGGRPNRTFVNSSSGTSSSGSIRGSRFTNSTSGKSGKVGGWRAREQQKQAEQQRGTINSTRDLHSSLSQPIRGASIRGSNVSSSNVSSSNVRGSNIRGSSVRGSNTGTTNIRGANVRGSALRGNDNVEPARGGIRGSALNNDQKPPPRRRRFFNSKTQ